MRLLFVWKILFIFLTFPLWPTPQEMLQEAYLSYQQGEKATTFEERKQAFNRALYLYSLIEQESNSPDPSLDHALADTYFQLQEYAWAILHYQRSLKQQPHSPLTLSHLEKVQNKLGLPPVSHQNPFYLSFFIPAAKQFEWLFWVTIFTFLTYSCTIWFSSSWVRKIAISGGCILFLMLAYLLGIYYFTPIEGILVTSTGLYRAPDETQSQLTPHPLLAGSKVKILQSTKEGEWLKISNSEGLIGYIPTLHLRLI